MRAARESRGSALYWAGAAALSAALVAGAASADGAVIAPHAVTVGLTDNSVFANGYTAADGLITVEAKRGGVVLGRAFARANGAGEISVNGGDAAVVNDVCWDSTGVTPDLLPGDTVTLTTAPAPPATKLTDTTDPLPSITIEDAVESGPDLFRITGTAIRANGTTIPSSQLAHVLRGPGPLNGFAELVAPGHASIVPGPTAGSYRIDYLVTTPEDAAPSVAASLSTLTWTSVLGSESVVVSPGPAPDVEACSAPFAQDAITELSPSVVGAANADRPIVIKGFSQAGADFVTISVDDIGHPETSPISVTAVPFTPSATPGAGGTWTVSVPSLQTLVDGPIVASITSSVGGTPSVGRGANLLKDVVAPSAPLPSVAPGLVAANTPVTLSASDAVGPAVIRYTLDGSVPDAAATIASGPIAVSAGGARVRAVAFDAAGNRSPESDLQYVVLDGTRNAVTTSSVPSLTAEAVRSPVTISGVAQVDATAVSVSLTSGGITVGPVPATLDPVSGSARPWHAAVAPLLLQRLPDGPVTVAATVAMGALSYTNGVAPLTGGTLVLQKDTVGPKAVLRASVPPGTFVAGSLPRVRISGCPRGAALRYTKDGSTPRLDSASRLPIVVRETFVRVRAACLDRVGNAGGTRSFTYRAIVGRLPSAPLVTPRSARIPLGRARLGGLRIEVPVNFVEPTRIRLVTPGGRVLVDRLGAIVPGAKRARLVLSAGEVRRALRPGIVHIVIGPFGKTIEVARLPVSLG